MDAAEHEAVRRQPAALLRAARAWSGLTQRELATRAGVSQPVIAAYESGRRQPTAPTLRRLLSAAGHDLVLDAVPQRVNDAEKALLAARRQKLATEPGRYDSRPQEYLSLLRALRDVERLRERWGLPPLPADDSQEGLRATAHRLGLVDAQA
jgi:transcriptional regulator with XRE-family HTH domain